MPPVQGQPGDSGNMTALSDSYRQASHIPEINADRCVHRLIANASCRACVDVCHAQACGIDDEQMGIDPELCDSCGICAAVCPETVISHAHSPISIHWRSERIALFACEKIPNHHPDTSESMVSCIHALSIRDLVKLYATGHHRLLVCTAPCGDCSRGKDRILDKHIDTLNSLLWARDEPTLERVNISTTQWLSILHSADHSNTGEKISRRNFLHRAAVEVRDLGLRQFELSTSEEAAPEPIAKLLKTAVNKHILPYVPKIDTGRCTACDTCFKLCPHQALTLDEKEASVAYLISAEKCTACGICVDVCEDDAISISRNTIASDTAIVLNQYQCRDCGIDFHTLAGTQELSCTICQKKIKQAPLFQVLD